MGVLLGVILILFYGVSGKVSVERDIRDSMTVQTHGNGNMLGNSYWFRFLISVNNTRKK